MIISRLKEGMCDYSISKMYKNKYVDTCDICHYHDEYQNFLLLLVRFFDVGFYHEKKNVKGLLERGLSRGQNIVLIDFGTIL